MTDSRLMGLKPSSPRKTKIDYIFLYTLSKNTPPPPPPQPLPNPHVFQTAAAGYRLDSQLSAPHRFMTLGS